MLEKLSIRTFKSLADVTVDLGLVNGFIGANGSGKSNLLEALGVLSAASDGKVDDRSLLSRGVRPGVPALYKAAFPARGTRIPPHLYFGARSALAEYRVSLHNPLKDRAPAWRFKTESWQDKLSDEPIVSRGPAQRNKPSPDRGLAALKAVEAGERPAMDLLRHLQRYVIFSPTTPVLRGVAPETQPAQPVGLAGGNLPQATLELLRGRGTNDRIRRICTDALELIDWARSFGSAPSAGLALSPSAAASDRVIRFSGQVHAGRQRPMGLRRFGGCAGRAVSGRCVRSPEKSPALRGGQRRQRSKPSLGTRADRTRLPLVPRGGRKPTDPIDHTQSAGLRRPSATGRPSPAFHRVAHQFGSHRRPAGAHR